MTDTLFKLPRRKARRRGRKGRAVVKGVRFCATHPDWAGECPHCRTWNGLQRHIGQVRAWCRLRRKPLELIALRATDDEGESWRPMNSEELLAFMKHTQRGE